MLSRLKKNLIKRRVRKIIRLYARNHVLGPPGFFRPQPVTVEPFFDSFVATIGGKRISEFAPDQGNMTENADYIFEDANIIAELKSLEADYSIDDVIDRLASAATELNLSSDDIEALVTLEKKPDERVMELFQKRFRRYLEERLKKAKRQLRSSTNTHGNDHTRKIIIIFNDNIIFPTNADICSTMALLMRQNIGWDDVDAICYYSGNIYALFDWVDGDYRLFLPFYDNDEMNAELSTFVDNLGSKLLHFHANFHGVDGTATTMGDAPELLEFLRGSRQER